MFVFISTSISDYVKTSSSPQTSIQQVRLELLGFLAHLTVWRFAWEGVSKSAGKASKKIARDAARDKKRVLRRRCCVGETRV